jgi:hypothetical protein
MADSSFDVVSNVNRQEIDNALNQAKKELAQRFDFKNTGTSIDWSGDAVTIVSKTDKRAEAALDVFKDKLVRRKVSLKALEASDPRPAGGATYRIECSFIQGIPEEKASRSPRPSASPASRSRPRSRTTSSGSPARAGMSSRRPSRSSKSTTKASPSSSRITGDGSTWPLLADSWNARASGSSTSIARNAS